MNFMEWGSNVSDAEDVGEKITNRYRHFGVEFDIKETKCLNNIFKYRIRLSKTSRFCDLQKNVEDVRRGVKLRHLSVVIKNSVDIWIIASLDEINNTINLFDVLNDTRYREFSNDLALAHPIGVDEMGSVIVKDLALYPHLLIAGTTGSGKSTAVKALIISLLYTYFPDNVNLVISDPAGELLIFNGFPHLSCPVITDFDKFYIAVLQLHNEMQRRISLKASDEFEYLPYIIFIADEFISLTTGNEPEKKEARNIFQQILRMGRHAKIHIVAVAFNPTAKNLNLDSSDLPSRMAFKVAKLSNSIGVIGCGGAEKLSGNGDMLFQSSQNCELQRIQGFNLPLQDELILIINEMKDYWKDNRYIYQYHFYISWKYREALPNISIGNTKSEIKNKQLVTIITWTLGHSTISSNELMQTFKLGWNNAKKIMLQLENFGVVSPLESKLPRKILPKSAEDLPDELINILKTNGYSDDDISDLFHSRE